jgi:hypothetical protein
MIKAVILNVGYVETTRMGHLFLVPQKEFPNKIEAIKDIANSFFEQWRLESGIVDVGTKRSCCDGILINSKQKFCSYCGKKVVEKKIKLSEEEIEQFERDFSLWMEQLPCAMPNCSSDLKNWQTWESIANYFPLTKENTIVLHSPEKLFFAIAFEPARKGFLMEQNRLNETKLNLEKVILSRINSSSI